LRAVLAVLAPLAVVGCGSGTGHRPVRRGPAPTPERRVRTEAQIPVPASPQKLLGQRIMVGFDGTAPSAELLDRIRLGRIGAVVLFANNIVSTEQVTALTSELQRAAREGRNPPLLIAVDQEGGQVKRFAAGPPSLSPPQIAATGSPPLAFGQGRATGLYLKARGVNMDLAPVVDVPTFTGAFIWQQGRAFSFDAATVAAYATQFARGLQSAGVAATAKHFPSLGSAAIDTDDRLQSLDPTAAQLAAGLEPYRAMIAHGLDAVMLSLAAVPAYDPSGTPTALSERMIDGLLRGRLRFRGLTITDSLGSPTGHDERTAGVLAARAGADMLLYTDAAPGVLYTLEAALGDGQISRTNADDAYRRIVALKRRVAAR
jgi:beta-N-acetylhexosaminidase